ncbi:hypothetical protein MTO96_009955 [Rhipicephalus appendiculatus]
MALPPKRVRSRGVVTRPQTVAGIRCQAILRDSGLQASRLIKQVRALLRINIVQGLPKVRRAPTKVRRGLSIGPGGDKCGELIGGYRSGTGAEDGALKAQPAGASSLKGTA